MFITKEIGGWQKRQESNVFSGLIVGVSDGVSGIISISSGINGLNYCASGVNICFKKVISMSTF